MNTNSQFGLASLRRKAKHRFTPQVVKDILRSERFQSPLGLWKIFSDFGSNTKSRFETPKMLRSSDGGLTLCYMLRRLGANILECYRTLALQAIDASIQWWKGKPAPRAIALRAPWCKLQISVGTAGPQPRADLSGHCRTSSLLAPDVSGHCRTSTAVSMSERMADRMSE